MNEYLKQATDFLTKTNTTLDVVFLKHDKHFVDDEETRDIYSITLKRGTRSYTFNFGQSINNSGFYYTKGKRIINLDRKHLMVKNLGVFIKTKLFDYDFLNNGKSDKIHYPIAPNAYDILACLQKYDVGSLENFCDEFGYNTDSIKANKTYDAIVKEFNALKTLFSDIEMEELSEIN